jgi:predicted nucleic acid-binding protein
MPRVPSIYLDTCALIRLFDEGSQARVRAESHAVQEFLIHASQRTVGWVVSEVLEAGIMDRRHTDRHPELLELFKSSAEWIIMTDEAFRRADFLEKLGYGAFDALHLACAEQALVDGLLTTDDRLIRRVQRGLGKSTIRVENPVDWNRRLTP